MFRLSIIFNLLLPLPLLRLLLLLLLPPKVFHLSCLLAGDAMNKLNFSALKSGVELLASLPSDQLSRIE